MIFYWLFYIILLWLFFFKISRKAKADVSEKSLPPSIWSVTLNECVLVWAWSPALPTTDHHHNVVVAPHLWYHENKGFYTIQWSLFPSQVSVKMWRWAYVAVCLVVWLYWICRYVRTVRAWILHTKDQAASISHRHSGVYSCVQKTSDNSPLTVNGTEFLW